MSVRISINIRIIFWLVTKMLRDMVGLFFIFFLLIKHPKSFAQKKANKYNTMQKNPPNKPELSRPEVYSLSLQNKAVRKMKKNNLKTGSLFMIATLNLFAVSDAVFIS